MPVMKKLAICDQYKVVNYKIPWLLIQVNVLFIVFL